MNNFESGSMTGNQEFTTMVKFLFKASFKSQHSLLIKFTKIYFWKKRKKKAFPLFFLYINIFVLHNYSCIKEREGDLGRIEDYHRFKTFFKNRAVHFSYSRLFFKLVLLDGGGWGKCR